MTYIIYKLKTTSFLKIVGWFYQVNNSILIRLQVIEIDSKVLKKKSQLSQKNSQFYQKNSQLFQKNSQLSQKNSQLSQKNSQESQKNSQFSQKTLSLKKNILQKLFLKTHQRSFIFENFQFDGCLRGRMSCMRDHMFASNWD